MNIRENAGRNKIFDMTLC